MAILYNVFIKFPNAIKRRMLSFIFRHSCKKCGKNITIGNGCKFKGIQNITFGNDVHFGDNNTILCTKAPIIIGDHFMSGPNVMLISGNHRLDILDKPMTMITEKEKKGTDDEPIVFKGDNWVGAGAIVLKGVTVGVGAVIGAGAVVTKDIDDYCIVAGNPARVIRNRRDFHE